MPSWTPAPFFRWPRELDLGLRWTGRLRRFAVDLGAAQAFNAGHMPGQAKAVWLGTRRAF